MDKTVEFFIEKVKNRPCLWNQHHVSYRDMSRKDLAWERIAKECGMANGNEAKMQWKKLRDSHREALRRRKPSYGPSAQHLGPWKYEEDMKFIVSQMEYKDSSCFCNDSNDIEDNGSDHTTEINNSLEVAMPNLAPSQESSCITDSLYSEPERKIDIADLLEEREKLREERDRFKEQLLRQTLELNHSDAITKFFDSLCQKTRDLPKYLQLRIQREIFESVTRAEEEALSLNSSAMSGYGQVPSSSSQSQSNATAALRDSAEAEDYEIESEYETKFSIDEN